MTSDPSQGGRSSSGAPAPTHRQGEGPPPSPDTVEAPAPGVAPDATAAVDVGDITWADEMSTTPTRAIDDTVEAQPGEDLSFGAGAPADTAPAADAAPADGGAPVDGGAAGAAGANHGTAGVDPGAGTSDPVAGDGAGGEISVEDLVQDLERVSAERDQYLDASRRLQAEFENYRKQVAKREAEAKERANEGLVNEILPVLDACDGALASGATDVEPVRAALFDALVKQGLDRIDDPESPFDPARHDAVMHEPDEGGNGPVVAEVMRAGYSWKGRVVRPAMVRVRG